MNAEQIGARLAARLLLCTVAQGAETDLGRVVYRGRRKIDDESMPCVVLVEGTDSNKGTAGVTTTAKLALPFAVHAYVPCDPDNPNLAGHRALRDIKRAIFGDPDTRWVRGITYEGRDIAPRVDGAAFVLAAIEISVELAEDLANP